MGPAKGDSTDSMQLEQCLHAWAMSGLRGLAATGNDLRLRRVDCEVLPEGGERERRFISNCCELKFQPFDKQQYRAAVRAMFGRRGWGVGGIKTPAQNLGLCNRLATSEMLLSSSSDNQL